MSEARDEAAEIEATLGHAFRDPGLLALALSHASFANEADGTRGNERLEFLGDAVVGLAVARELFDAHPDWEEGDLTRARAALVNRNALADGARRLDLGRYVRLGRAEHVSGGAEKDRVLANSFEAVAGAIYLDGGLEAAVAFTRRALAPALAAADTVLRRDAKTAFQEWAHAEHAITPRYETVDDSGTENDDARFTALVRIGEDTFGRGVGRSKRAAETAAAEAALEQLGIARD